jgi:hypothetical protein
VRVRLFLLSILVAAVGFGLFQGGGAVSPRAAAATTCGVERWAVKTLSDKRERLVNFKPKNSSVGRLGKKPAPHIGSNTPRIKGVETTTYRVKARLVEIPSAPSNTMIVEFPDTTCNGASSSPKKAKMASARSSIIAACGQPSSSHFTNLNGTATVTGVGFLDIPHGQSGVAPNAI